MGPLFAALLVAWVAGPLVLLALMRGEWRRGARIDLQLALACLQVLVSVWILALGAVLSVIEPWLENQAPPEAGPFAEGITRSAAVGAILWVPAAITLLVLAVRSLHRGEPERAHLPLVAALIFFGALAWVWFASGVFEAV